MLHTRLKISLRRQGKGRIGHLLLQALSLALFVTLLSAALPGPAAANPTTDCVKNYVVKSGETIQDIASNFGLNWKDLANINNLKRPYKLTTGDKLCIPAKGNGSVTEDDRNYSVVIKSSGNTLTITASGFKSTYSYFVRVRKVSENTWYKVGTLRVDKKNKVNSTFELPRDLHTASQLQVCLKNTTTDGLICRLVNLK